MGVRERRRKSPRLLVSQRHTSKSYRPAPTITTNPAFLTKTSQQRNESQHNTRHDTQHSTLNTRHDSVLFGAQARFFDDEAGGRGPSGPLKHDRKGLVGVASAGKNLNASQFYLTLGEQCSSLDGKRTIFGAVGEGMEVLDKIGAAFVDGDGRPYQNIR